MDLNSFNKQNTCWLKNLRIFIFCGCRYLKIYHRERFAPGKAYINGFEGFSDYVKENLTKHHSISSEKNLLSFLREINMTVKGDYMEKYLRPYLSFQHR